MIVLDEPFVSEPLFEWLEQSGHPVLYNGKMQHLVPGGRQLNLVSSSEAVRRIDAGERVYTNSENALAWIIENTHNRRLSHAIEVFKNKVAMRSELASLDPDFFFLHCSAKELPQMEFDRLPVPFVLKPSVGFCSVGVYTIRSQEHWDQALADIAKNASLWQERYPESVIGADSFVLESFIEGTEYAIDAYFDESGCAHVLNILRHDFSTPNDTSDRMYVTSAALVRENIAAFTAWLNAVNKLVGALNFPVHVEVRVDEGSIRPIEFNPLRFAGLGGTDVSYYAYGYRTYEAFLEDNLPDFEAAFKGKDDKIYTMSLLNPPEGVDAKARFDYDAFGARFSRVIELRPFEVSKIGSYGFLFLETEVSTAEELVFLQNTDLREFLR